MNREIKTKDKQTTHNPVVVKSTDSVKKKRMDLGQSTSRMSHESMKDSGIGATYLATSSGSTSENTSPESEKDLQVQNGKAPKTLSSSTIDATSTPATATRNYKLTDHATHLGSEATRKHFISCGDLTFDEDSSMHKMGTPLANRSKVTTKYDSATKSNATRSTIRHTSTNKEVITKFIENFNEVSQTPGRRRQRRMHACEFCDKQFDRPSLLKRHNLTHTGERPFECRFCSKGFSTRSGVNTHERTHTGQRPYVCRICGRRFAAGSNLIFHKYTHTNTRRHVCSQCPKAFVTPGDLRKHEYTHTGEWPFRCHLCDRGFATERNLRSHEITHTGQKPHVCPICGKGYAQESSMKTHLRSHQKTNASKLENTPMSLQKKDNKAAFKELQSTKTTSVMHHNIINQALRPSSEDIPLNSYHASDMRPMALNQSVYSIYSDTIPGTSHPIIVPPQYKSAFSVPQPTIPIVRNPVPTQQPRPLNPAELQSLLYDRYRAYYELYMKALNDPRDNSATSSTWNQNYSSPEPQIDPSPASHYSAPNSMGLHSVSNLQVGLPYLLSDPSRNQNTFPIVMAQNQSGSAQSPIQQNLLFRPAPSVLTQSQQQQPHSSYQHSSHHDQDNEPLDYSVRGLSHQKRK